MTIPNKYVYCSRPTRFYVPYHQTCRHTSIIVPRPRASWRFSLFFGGGGSGTFWGEHSVEDHYLHINGIIFLGGSKFFFFLGGGATPPKTGIQEALVPNSLLSVLVNSIL